MIREVLFRGKRKDNGEWVKGYYTCMNGNHHRIYTGYAETDCGNYYPDWDEVIPETVGQYTGLTDKSGKKIFEGDIVLTDEDENAIVKWDDNDAMFTIDTDTISFNFGDCWACEFEIIGNIHDNLEEE